MAKLDWLIARPIAHRGLHDRARGRVENTLAAARAAIERNYAIECDLVLSADGVPVVFHDDTLDRLTEASGRIGERTLAELQAIRLPGTDDRIPAFAELLETVGGRVPLVVELKSEWNGDRSLERQVAPMVAAYRGRACVMSFDPDSMAAMKRLAPAVPRGLIADHFDPDGEGGDLTPLRRFALRHLFAVPAVGASFVSYGLATLPAPAPLLLHRFGLTLITWTVRTPADAAKAKRYVDQITFEGFDPDSLAAS
ncbi:MAG TPA: glycerophosphodiester phosphodiesterase family protein [Bauldia sp.]|nr:glycerophosphodiester phosphodiesterase family protein [Bauldia sp.]